MVRKFRQERGGLFIGLMLLLGVVIGVVLPLLLDVELGLALALALGVPSLIYGSFQFADASDTINKLFDLEKALRSDTERLEQQLPTRQLGNAADFLPQIIEMLGEAEKRVTICCDFPAYGAITHPDEHVNYASALRHLRRDVEINLLHLDEAAQRDIASDAHGRVGNSVIPEEFINNEAGFLDHIAETNKRALEEQFRDAKRFETSFVMPLFFWIVDSQAVFALRRITKTGDVEVGFQTDDRVLIGALRDIFTRYVEMSGRYQLVNKLPV
jgi:hypothetical protein